MQLNFINLTVPNTSLSSLGKVNKQFKTLTPLRGQGVRAAGGTQVGVAAWGGARVAEAFCPRESVNLFRSLKQGFSTFFFLNPKTSRRI